MILDYLILKGSAKLEKAEILQMTVDHLKMLQATGGKGKRWYHCFDSFLPFSFHPFPLIVLRKLQLNRPLTSWERQPQIKAVAINANGRIELVGKDFLNKRSTWPWTCVCFPKTVGLKLPSQQPGQGFEKCMLESTQKTKTNTQTAEYKQDWGPLSFSLFLSLSLNQARTQIIQLFKGNESRIIFAIASPTVLAFDFTPTTTLEGQVPSPCWKKQQNRRLRGRTQSSGYPGLASCRDTMPLTVHCGRTVRSASDPHSKSGPNPEGCNTPISSSHFLLPQPDFLLPF